MSWVQAFKIIFNPFFGLSWETQRKYFEDGFNSNFFLRDFFLSSLIGKKISATLSSTGSPSQYINCAEANHGDLGIIENDDIILALSKSGETNEMVNILNYAKRRSIKIISITINDQAGSTISVYNWD